MRETSNNVTTKNSSNIGAKVFRSVKIVKRRSGVPLELCLVPEWIVICLSWVKFVNKRKIRKNSDRSSASLMPWRPSVIIRRFVNRSILKRIFPSSFTRRNVSRSSRPTRSSLLFRANHRLSNYPEQTAMWINPKSLLYHRKSSSEVTSQQEFARLHSHHSRRSSRRCATDGLSLDSHSNFVMEKFSECEDSSAVGDDGSGEISQILPSSAAGRDSTSLSIFRRWSMFRKCAWNTIKTTVSCPTESWVKLVFLGRQPHWPWNWFTASTTKIAETATYGSALQRAAVQRSEA